MAHIDSTLLVKCKKGVVEAQMELYDMLFNPLFYTSYRIVGVVGEAQDIVQESFLKIFDRLERHYDNPPTIEYALKRIVINASIDSLRRRKVQFVDISAADTITYNDTEEQDMKTENIERVKRAVEQLADGFRTVISLKLFEQMDFEDIALKLGVTESTVRSQYIRAKKRILEQL